MPGKPYRNECLTFLEGVPKKGSATRDLGRDLYNLHSPMPPRLLSLQLILQPPRNCLRRLTFQGLSLPSSGLKSKLFGEIIDFPRQSPVLCFPRFVVCLDLSLELVKRLVCRCRILEKGPIVTQKEMIEELVGDVKILMLNISSLT